MKKVLVITYYWPPSGGSGVQRWLKLCKYLPEFGWEPIVYTPENPDVGLTDASLEADVRLVQQVIKRPIVEPRRIYNRLRGAPGGNSADADKLLYVEPSDRSRLQTAVVWLRSNLLIPDARALWIRPSVRFLTRYLANNPVSAVISTGPPHSMHLIARDLKRKFGLPWIADFRDPWTGIVYFDRIPLSNWALKRHRRLEASVITEADAVVDISPSLAEDDGRRGAKRVVTIYNGFDPADLPAQPVELADQYLISHVGVLSADRNHESFWEALAALARNTPGLVDDLEVRLIGRVDRSALESAERHGLAGAVKDVGYVAHDEAIREMQAASVLLLAINRSDRFNMGISPGKLYEYLATGRPILLIGPTDGDAAEILRLTGGGAACDYDDVTAIANTLEVWYKRHREGNLEGSSADISKFSRLSQARDYAGLLDGVLAHT